MWLYCNFNFQSNEADEPGWPGSATTNWISGAARPRPQGSGVTNGCLASDNFWSVNQSVSLLFPVSLDILISDEKRKFEKYRFER